MTGQPQTAKYQRKGAFFPLLLIAGGLLAAVVFGGASSAHTSNVHGSVIAWARANPSADVPVIIQTSGNSAALTSDIARAGGSIDREFKIISALEATLPRDSIDAVAAHPDVAWIGLNSPVVSTGTYKVDLKALATTYPISVNANDPWSKSYTGAGVGVAVVDTGISPSGHEDFKRSDGNSRVVAEVVVNPGASNITDGYGHGTHVAGIIGGDGSLLNGKYVGIAPEANLINVKIADDSGLATVGDAIAGLQWVYENRTAYNIRVVNLSLHSSVAESYRTSALDAAVESLWFNGVFVVVAAGNLGSAPDAVSYPPSNDPFVMTIGAIDDMDTSAYGDDTALSWSSSGTTQDGFVKPELHTPGRNIISVADTNSYLYQWYPGRVVDKDYLSLSGTSMAAGVMSGVGALVLERHPDWRPGELKCTLITTSRQLSAPYSNLKMPRAGNASNQSIPSCNSDAGLTPSQAFGPMAKAGVIAYVLGEPSSKAVADSIGLDMAAAGIQGASLASVDWSAIKWSAIKWSAIKWNLVQWDAIKWSAIKWNSVNWNAVSSDGVDWSAIKWSAIKWSAIQWNAIKWSAIKWNSVNFDAVKWSAIKWSFVQEN